MPSEEDLGIGTFQHTLPRPQHYEDSGSSQTVALWPFYSALRTVMGVEGEPTSFILRSKYPDTNSTYSSERYILG